jgi:hypothetical protein
VYMETTTRIRLKRQENEEISGLHSPAVIFV